MKLIDAVAMLADYDERDPEGRLTIYAEEPWTCDSACVVVPQPESGATPTEAEGIGATYFIGVFTAKHFLDDWMALERRPMSFREQCERLIYYAVHDA